ncbi:acyl-CoA synthetase (AMP-forming)/AMP-acid ligase II [Desulfosporosinus orientis DSM 765]|uniref:Acyl-CoA synthetase (AMP-forming)/AMP-acid ligase II n=1 Tax=Desulfosporosinus orientis (strain ATCC 19365 / DSM 765 / NCIMB 8382 / VKM B-1628 / Singapore I) TaxID=768706 RepID=G7WCJ8_DESOD|nr:long-chain fatty acid--CoA ligase [Desulfosporosinus orientis]AET66536.1 acyl-CoA synthetase (AMP-forming)/AMP-acid ligase II [Desulfosporosinus orientis DSM 765]
MQVIEKPWLKSYPSYVSQTQSYPQWTLGEMFDDTVNKMPETTAIIFEGKKITYKEFGDQVNRFAAALADMGIKKGERVGLMGPNCPQWETAFYALLKLGVIVVQTNPMYVEREIAYQMKDSGATVIIVFEPLYPTVKNIIQETSLQQVIAFNFIKPVESTPDLYSFDELIAKYEPNPPKVSIDQEKDLAVLQYTGGTTGVSKGVMLSHQNLVCNTFQSIAWSLDLEYGKERVLTILPVFHVYGMTNCVNYAVACAATQILLPRFELDNFLEVINKYKPTLFPGAPTIYMAINGHPRISEYKNSLAAIKVCNSGSAPLPLEVALKFGEVTEGKGNLVEGYGLSEASPVTHSNPLDRPTRAGSIGIPFPDTDSIIVDLETGEKELAVGEIGELCIRGPQVMKGYWGKEKETAETLRNGWLHTGDIAKRDEDGYFYIIDRKKDMIIAGGFNIYPRDIEEVLYEHPKVKEVVVAGVPDKYRGETPKAYIVLKSNVNATEEEFITFCRSKMAAFKVPRLIEFRNELPRTIVGKVLRRQLVEEEKAKIEAAASAQA